MIQGVSSDAGKSFIATGLCRWLSRQGLKVAPFKAQNMSNNARVVEGGEIGSAQWLQAIAAGVTPDVRMNPILLKPESDRRSQVILNGVANEELTNQPWRGRSPRLWPHVVAAYESLAREYEFIIIEGAGSPAETNLWADDVVNMRVAELGEAPVLLVADINRGGAFAHLYGTWALLLPDHQARLSGFILNKFRGDPALLEPAPQDLEARCGVRTIGVIPWISHDLPDEEGPTVIDSPSSGPRVGIICGPYASNLDEFVALQRSTYVTFVRSLGEFDHFDLIILPGSKHVAKDIEWIHEKRLDERLRSAASEGTAILGICGGLQILGGHIDAVEGVEGASDGLNLLAVSTTLEREKQTRAIEMAFPAMTSPWGWLSGQHVTGYEIHHGVTSGSDALSVSDGRLVFGSDNLLGLYFHGLFENPSVLESFSGNVRGDLDVALELLADTMEEHLDASFVMSCLGLATS
ncbi:MAG: Cobyric acid synthase [Acidimicrobiaceae bacterium]|nr:Cobyric acid synthase [Acidimicrobiaceae bacterium]